MTALTAAQDVALARVRVIVTAAPAGAQLVREVAGVQSQVRGGQVSGDVIVDDYECPFGVPVTYRLLPVNVTAATQLDVTTPWLTHPTDPSLSRPVHLVDDNPHTYAAPGTVHEVLGSEWPVVVYSRRTQHTGTMTVRSTWDQRADVDALIRPGSPLLLRVPPGCYADDGWRWPARVTRDKPTAYDPDHLTWTFDYQRVATPGGPVTNDPGNAWAAVVATHTTWADTVAAHPTWLDLLQTPHPH